MTQTQKSIAAALAMVNIAALTLIALRTFSPHSAPVNLKSEMVAFSQMQGAQVPISTSSAIPTPTRSQTLTPTVSLTVTTTLTFAKTSRLVPAGQQLPSLYVDGPYLKRSDAQQLVWLKGVNVEEFRQRNPHTLGDLLYAQGLGLTLREKWGINFLRVAIDPETVESTSPEIDKLITFAKENGMYILLVPFPSAVNPARYEQRLSIPDNVVSIAMGFLADKFKDRTNVLYGIWNEPHPDSIPFIGYDLQWQVWMESGIKVAQSISSKNPQAILVVPGGTKWGRDLTFYKDHPFPFDNVIYDAHDYSAPASDHYTRNMWTWAIGKYPLLIGEFGGNPISPSDSSSITYMEETLGIVNRNPGLVHYALYALTDDGAWGIFARGLGRMPKGILLLDDLKKYPPTQFR